MNPNQQWWDERAHLHGQDDVYDTAAFLAGASTLFTIDHETVGDATGKDLVHLQCHTGLDTLSWLRAGARTVTGIDFSDVAMQKATTTARDAGLAERATFRTADVLDLPDDLDAGFDICYASRGVLTWVADLPAWMRGAARVLRPGGQLSLIDMHPLYVMAGSLDPLVLDFPYFDDGPQHSETSDGTYADPGAHTAHNTTVEYGHSVAEIVTAALQAGLQLQHLGEHAAVETDANRGLARREDDGLIRWRHNGQLLPIMLSLRARKPSVV